MFFLPIRTFVELNCHIQETNALTIFHEDWATNKSAPPPGGHTIFELVRDINETNVLTKSHDDWAKSVTSRVFTRNTAPPPGGHVFQWTKTFFELNHHIIKTNILTKLHEDWASNVTSTVTNLLTKFHEDLFTRQMLTTDGRRTDDGQKAITKAHHEHVVLR
ncbi:hypothetical protein DPMN_121728 [Dreissena polymorpha]|uniref:Uncharacterized protein n=1 Tax=Dreissena polymorpha TaxID=45954 RepID=A0A9D4GMM9_DREPO|nr:hypothetical protein DPMN_121728 [Dreissena polymorpha]